jgi:hypothetical protein
MIPDFGKILSAMSANNLKEASVIGGKRKRMM